MKTRGTFICLVLKIILAILCTLVSRYTHEPHARCKCYSFFDYHYDKDNTIQICEQGKFYFPKLRTMEYNVWGNETKSTVTRRGSQKTKSLHVSTDNDKHLYREMIAGRTLVEWGCFFSRKEGRITLSWIGL